MKTLALLIPFFFFISCFQKTPPHGGDTKKEAPYSKSLQKTELDTAALSLSANLFYQTNNYDEAVKEYTKLIELDMEDFTLGERIAWSRQTETSKQYQTT